MPELPEVETIARDLRPKIVGQIFCAIFSEVPQVVLPAPENFSILTGLKVLSVGRRGKFLSIFFEQDFVVTVHLRMTGRLVSQGLNEPELQYERTRLDFGDFSLRFCDLRKFGRVWLNKMSDFEQVTGIWKLGVEPLEELDVGTFKALMNGKRGDIKKNLLDQSLVAGIGNIYADEACFYAGVRPDRETTSLKEEELERLFESVLKALNQGIRNRGTSVSDYADAYGKNGKNQEVLHVYGRGGKPCVTCGRELIKCRVAGRGTVYCEGCQN